MLIEEAREALTYLRGVADGWGYGASVRAIDTILANALAAAQTPGQPVGIPDRLDEREALKSALTDGYWKRTGHRTAWQHIGPLMDSIFAAGFHLIPEVEEIAKVICGPVAPPSKSVPSGRVLAWEDQFDREDAMAIARAVVAYLTKGAEA